jgi:hypothetical protein
MGNGALQAVAMISTLLAGRSPYHVFVAGEPGAMVSSALDGARHRLETAECQRVFDDFVDEAGRPLAASVSMLGQSPADLLAALYFVDGDDTAECRADDGRAAFTEPRSHVIHVCGRRFARFARKTNRGEILLIHELLHALGLRENPPASAEITSVVLKRCG